MKKLCLMLAVVFFITSFMSIGVIAQAETEDDFPCGGVVEMLEVEILYSPILNRIAFSGCTSIEGTVLRITYHDGKTEVVTVEKADDGYRAGDFRVVFPYGSWNEVNVIEYGFVYRTMYITKDDTFWHSYGYVEFGFLNLPSFSDIFSLMDFLLRAR